MKKLLAMALALLMVAVLLPITAMAAEVEVGTYEEFKAAVDAGNSVKFTADISGNGLVVAGGKDLVIDLGGFTYTIDGNTVGSSGTETNGMQLLQGSTITIKNGTITSTKAKILIQNYCNLTLDGVILDGSSLRGYGPYTLSNNHGNTVITGNTNIIAKTGGVAFDVYYWPDGGYGDGVTVTFDDSFTGKVDGNIEYGTDGTPDGKANWSEKAKLNINGNGTFTGEISAYNLLGTGNSDPKDAAITVTGGTFTNADTQALVANFIPDDMQINNNGTVVEKQHTVIIITDDSTDTTTTTEKPANPTTGANDFVGVAAAAAVMALLGSAVVLRKK